MQQQKPPVHTKECKGWICVGTTPNFALTNQCFRDWSSLLAALMFRCLWKPSSMQCPEISLPFGMRGTRAPMQLDLKGLHMKGPLWETFRLYGDTSTFGTHKAEIFVYILYISIIYTPSTKFPPAWQKWVCWACHLFTPVPCCWENSCEVSEAEGSMMGSVEFCHLSQEKTFVSKWDWQENLFAWIFFWMHENWKQRRLSSLLLSIFC